MKKEVEQKMNFHVLIDDGKIMKLITGSDLHDHHRF